MYNLEKIINKTKKLKLLYVEDNQESRALTLIVLNELFDDVVVAVDGVDALEKFKSNNIAKENKAFDLTISDISMPYMDGLELSKAIKDIDYNHPIILLTALTQINVLKEAIDIGVDSFINKPLEDMDIFLQKISLVNDKLEYIKCQENLIKQKQEEEKIELFLNMIHNISHHWKQPLSVIFTIATSKVLEDELGIDVDEKHLEQSKIIAKQVDQLVLVLEKFEKIDFKTITIKELEDIIKISNPLCESKI